MSQNRRPRSKPKNFSGQEERRRKTDGDGRAYSAPGRLAFLQELVTMANPCVHLV
jgi:hypothetical protein